jgi:exonuclease III
LQEIYGHAAEETRDVIAEMLPDDPDGSAIEWQASAVESDIVVVSRYPIIDTFPIGGNGAFLIDPGEAYEKDLFLIVAHLPCCGSNEGRQREIDEIMAFIREAKEPGGVLDLHPGTPIVIMGDLNLVGYNQQLETLLTGDIVNTEDHGPAFTPDWDGTDLTDLLPIHTHLPMAYTWYNDNAYYWPGRLDYIIYSDSAAEPAKSFVLWTDAMPTRTLLDYGLEKGDTDRASDHLPVVCDLIVE